ncbi:hypothetical protein FT663_03926 [Candidozyma haemuli var. vulneris]|uniref:F-box domain-containing protein n=1 Tax=Candidozyma haemuli TaxID=45357 RepID=A0A2V1ASN7_9ASCO|nr:hypothetical protein CXQ85_004346 [[Candida] haemuloni]KAF3988694.1 hypothetical protein FT663_03926 [[Candida] haemuloni var. vulneris]PVH20838.1 hypothetical protein CXQ85_004346 [[Candida] haemuloni]
MVANTNQDGSRSSKRGKLASYISSQFSSSQNQNQQGNMARHNLEYMNEGRHSLDSEHNDYNELREALLQKRGSTGARSQIQTINFHNSRLLQLPTEVLLQVFKYLEKSDLYSLLTVCRELSDLIVEILWFRPNMQSDSPFQKVREVMKLPRSETHWDYRSYIKRLNLSFMTKLVDDELLYLFCGCPKLERLTLVNCTKLTYAPIAQVLKNCEHLQSIDMTGVQDIQNDIFYALAQHCTRLQGLYAPGCGNISEDAIIQVLKACPMLKRIKFNNSENITNNSILAMYENCRSLVEIDLHNCPKVTDKYLKGIFSELSQLREFRISNAPGITDDLFSSIPDDHLLDKLRIIDVTGCNAITDKLVERMVRCAPRLRNVVLSKCMQITDASLRHLTKLGRSLHYVHLGHCALITDFGVQALVRSCHRIQYIDLACCSQLTDWTLIELSGLPKLRRIGLVKCNLISDSGIMELVRRRGDQDCLERVHLSYCTNLTIGPIYLLLKNCPRLTHLSLTGISAFLRREITQYCRDPPPDFTENQKSSFCVFSGHGVVQLRNHLDTIMDQRAYILERYGFQDDVAPAYLPDRRVQPDARFTPAPGEPTQYPTSEQLNQLRMAGPGVLGNPGPVGGFAGAGDGRNIINDDEMTTWAAQRGLGELRRVRDAPAREVPARDTPVPMRPTNPAMLEHDAIFVQLMAPDVQARQRFSPFHNPLDAMDQRIRDNQAAMRWEDMGEPEQGNDTVNVRPGNAPHIAQAPVFGNDEPMNGGDEDSEMEGVDLFPRIR